LEQRLGRDSPAAVAFLFHAVYAPVEIAFRPTMAPFEGV